MVAPLLEPSLDEWINYCNNLTPYQNFLMIGLLFLRPHPPLSILPIADVVEEENARAAEKWSESNFRSLLLFYCKNREKKKVKGTIVAASDIVKKLAPLLVTTLSVPLGIAVSFLFWLVGENVKEWCDKYSPKNYNGKGIYMGEFPENQLDCFFEITYTPPIKEFVEDPAAYPLKGFKMVIKVEPEFEGRAKTPSSKELNSVRNSFQDGGKHKYNFKDTVSKDEIKGSVDNIIYRQAKDGTNSFRFRSTDFQVLPSTQP